MTTEEAYINLGTIRGRLIVWQNDYINAIKKNIEEGKLDTAIRRLESMQSSMLNTLEETK